MNRRRGAAAAALLLAATASADDAALFRNCVLTLQHISASESIRFDTSSSRVPGAHAAMLDAIANLLAQCPDTSLYIDGHTDDRGDAALNAALSGARARAVAEALAARGICAARLRPRGFGGTRPIADNTTRDGRRTNRRIELRLVREDDVSRRCDSAGS